MDDFGTGYSSLSYLQAFPCDTVKCFIRGIATDVRSREIVRGTIGLGHGLGIPVIAEDAGISDRQAARDHGRSLIAPFKPVGTAQAGKRIVLLVKFQEGSSRALRRLS